RPQPGLAALAFDRFDHGGLFAADVGASSAAEGECRNRARRSVVKRRQLPRQNRAAAVVLVSQVDIDVVDANRPGGDDGAFKKAMRVALEVIAVFERARLAFVDVNRHQPGSRFGGDDPPLAPGGKAGATKTAK